jgi:hypothetical protein
LRNALFGLVIALTTNRQVHAQTLPPENQRPVGTEENNQRILGVIPDYQTVRDPSRPFTAMSVREKWHLLLKETSDPFNIANAAFGAALSQADNETPQYGRNSMALAKRFGAAVADTGTQNIFSVGVLACLLHQDPRYFRRGPASSFVARAAYSLSRVVITKQDSGTDAFNTSNLLGNALGIGLSNAYYPPPSRTGTVMVSRIGTTLIGDCVGNLMSEFWPDIQSRFFSRKRKD